MSDLEKRLETFPEFMSADDLVFLGLYTTRQACYESRKVGLTPESIKMRRKVLYPKSCVIKFIEDRLQKGSE